MRRPKPRFDTRRNAWVTNAGGKLKTLAQGPKNPETEAEAWDVFYRHMAALGRSVEGASVPEVSLGELADEYADWMKRQVSGGEMAAATLEYYERYIQQFLDVVGGRRPASAILPLELERYKTGRSTVQTIQRLYNWGVEMGLLVNNQFRKIAAPEAGERQRTLTRAELSLFVKTTGRPFNYFLTAMFHTVARPQEVRAFQWKHLVEEPDPAFVLTAFKARRLRKDRKSLRVIALDSVVMRFIKRWQKERNPAPDDFIFLNSQGLPWTGSAVRCRMRRLREKLGFGPDEEGEQIVAYTLRHSSATERTIDGMTERALADQMGHTTTEMLRRYQHLTIKHLGRAMKQAEKDRRDRRA